MAVFCWKHLPTTSLCTSLPGEVHTGTGQNHTRKNAKSELKARSTMGPGWSLLLVLPDLVQ